MPYRTFVDRDGSYWQAWDSLPTKVERRMAGAHRRRQRQDAWRGSDRRSGTDRRSTLQRSITLSPGYGGGWLTFESLEEKRRLIPIPSHWEDLSQDELRSLCERAKRVSKTDGPSAA